VNVLPRDGITKQASPISDNVSIITSHREMPHLAPWARLFFAVQVHVSTRIILELVEVRFSINPSVTKQIHHCNCRTRHRRITK
jgi:hypothetical protein